MTRVFKGSYKGIGQLLRSDDVREHLEARLVERALPFAQSIAPVYEGPDEDKHRGRYLAGLKVTSTTRGGVHHDRAAAYLEATAPESIDVEFGNKHTPAHHVLLRALDATRD